MIWEQIRSNQIRSVFLVIGMGLLLLALGYFIGLYFFDSGIPGVVIALIVWGILNLVAYFQGDAILLAVAGARKIAPEDNPRLYNVVEEMKIASGLEKMPDIYIIDEPGLNAFATGRDPNHASVAITSGLLQKLNRDELQGVIGHEISHVKNRDVLLMTMAGIVLGSIVILAWYASRFLIFGGATRSRRSSSRGGGGGAGQIIIIVVAIVLMILAPIMAQLIYFALSRRREYLADASSALYTRYPEGLASALEKIGGASSFVSKANKATAPMYIANPFRREALSPDQLTSTHPPIQDRVRILRSMAGIAYGDYDKAYRSVHSGRGIMPGSALGLAAPEGKRGPSEETHDEVTQARSASEMLWRMHNYKTLTCQCGTKLRVPPNFKEPSVICPHCGRINKV